MADPIDCTTSPNLYVCSEPEPTPSPAAGAPPDHAESRRAAQAAADDRMASFVGEGGVSDPRAAAREGSVPLASTTRSLAQRKQDWEEHKQGIAERDKPTEFDAFTQALVGAGVGSVVGAGVTSLATMAEHSVSHSLAHAAFEGAEHQVHELGKENAERAREHQKAQPTSSPQPRSAPSACEAPLHSSSMYLAHISG